MSFLLTTHKPRNRIPSSHKGLFHSAGFCLTSQIQISPAKVNPFFLIPFIFLLRAHLKLFLPRGDSYHSGQENGAKNKLSKDLIYYLCVCFKPLIFFFLNEAATFLREALQGRWCLFSGRQLKVYPSNQVTWQGLSATFLPPLWFSCSRESGLSTNG